MANVIFKFGTRAQYDAIATKNTNTLYWLTDTQELMKGDVCFGKGATATAQASGLLSAEDKAKLDELAAGGLLSLTATDASILVSDADGGKSIGVQLSSVDGNILKLKDDGLFAEVDAIPIEKISGLEERLTTIEQGALSPVATAELNPAQLAVEDGILSIVGVESQLVGYRGQNLLDVLDEMSKALVWEELGTQVDPSTESAAEAIAEAEDGDVINFSDGAISAMTVDKSVTLRGATAGLAQNFAQEVET